MHGIPAHAGQAMASLARPSLRTFSSRHPAGGPRRVIACDPFAFHLYFILW